MLKAAMKKYKIKGEKEPRKLAILGFTEKIDHKQTAVCIRKLMKLYSGRFDAYIFDIPDCSPVTAESFKIIQQFSRLATGKVGILTGEKMEPALLELNLHETVIISHDMSVILSKIEAQTSHLR